MITEGKHRHGGPYDRGSADYYYWRDCKPHYYKSSTYNSEKVSAADMTAKEVAEYLLGYNSETERKDWG